MEVIKFKENIMVKCHECKNGFYQDDKFIVFQINSIEENIYINLHVCQSCLENALELIKKDEQ